MLYSAHNRMGDELASYDFFQSRSSLANGLAWVLDRTVPRIGDRCIPHSVNLQEFLLARGLAGRSEPVLNFGIDFDEHAPRQSRRLRRECGLGDEPIVLYSGVIDQVSAARSADRRHGACAPPMPQAKLLHPGEHSRIRRTNRQFAREAEPLGIAKSIILACRPTWTRAYGCCSMCDVAVDPASCAPGFPIKLLNYMAAQRPCVMFASSASGVPPWRARLARRRRHERIARTQRSSNLLEIHAAHADRRGRAISLSASGTIAASSPRNLCQRMRALAEGTRALERNRRRGRALRRNIETKEPRHSVECQKERVVVGGRTFNADRLITPVLIVGLDWRDVRSDVALDRRGPLAKSWPRCCAAAP